MVRPGEVVERFERDLEEGGYHYDAEDQDADGFKTPPADGVGFGVGGAAGDQPRGGPDDGGAEEVKSGVDERGEDRDGGCEDCDDYLQDEEEEVCEEVQVDGDCYDAVAAGGVFVGDECRDGVGGAGVDLCVGFCVL